MSYDRMVTKGYDEGNDEDRHGWNRKPIVNRNTEIVKSDPPQGSLMGMRQRERYKQKYSVLRRNPMPPGYVRTIREEILYEYAKLISRSAHGSLQRGFITERFKKLRDGEINISDTIREWEREQELPKECVFCGSREELTTDHLIPQNRGGDDSADNLVLACRYCSTSRRDKGIFEWIGLKKKDELHRLVAGKYLKQLLRIHEATGTAGVTKVDLGSLCSACPLPDVCAQWDSVGQLTCFCLESVLPHQ